MKRKVKQEYNKRAVCGGSLGLLLLVDMYRKENKLQVYSLKKS
jgi:hypothetical protein